jgi:hypothetical protein
MQIMGDGLAVLGSRHGMMWDPFNRRSYLVRFDRHPGIPVDLRVGLRLEGRTIVLPLAQEGAVFEFIDQEMTPTAMIMTGIDPVTGLKVRLHVRIPFLPRDAAWSTTPAYYVTASVSRLDKPFRWQRPVAGSVSGTLFVQVGGEALALTHAGQGLDVALDAPVTSASNGELPTSRQEPQSVVVHERLEALQGQATESGAEAAFTLNTAQVGPTVQLAWCAYAPALLNVFGEQAPFRYSESFSSLQDVVDWAREHAAEVEEAGAWFDELVGDHSLGVTTTHLLAQTLHAWLVNTWWVVRPSQQKEWFSVWEGSCYFHSTVDVEFTQSPFYLTLWPELLALELDQWPDFVKPGELCLGERGLGTLFLAHDMGILAACGKQAYPHDMEVEEAANYVLLSYAYWRRTGDSSLLRKHSETIRRFLDFVVACDTTGNGVPDRGCTNTIDDASPAIQYGREQVYLAVKALAALECGADLLEAAGYGRAIGPLGGASVDDYRRQAARCRTTVEYKGWLGDHYAVALDPSAEGLHDPWSGQALHGELGGWDAYHIYTPNTLPILDMLGRELGLDDVRIAQDAMLACQRTLARYGCRHSDYEASPETSHTAEGVAIASSNIGWVSMNMLRDMAAAYRGVDLLTMAERYWDWQATTNAREVRLFFETFGGNNLCFYPRGVAVWGYFEAAAGLVYDRVSGEQATNALRLTMRVPLLALADWPARRVPFFDA